MNKKLCDMDISAIDKNVKNIIFDLGGVIIDVDMPHCFKEVEALGVPVKEIMGNGNKGGATICEGLSMGGPMEQYQLGNISTHDFLGGILQLCKPGTTTQQVIDAWNSCLLDIPKARLDMIKNLRNKYKVYMLSNTNECHWQFIESKFFSAPNHTTDYYFDRVFLSQEMHLAKPDKRIYEEVLKAIGAKGEECLFIDDATVNLDAAASCGIHTLKADNTLFSI